MSTIFFNTDIFTNFALTNCILCMDAVDKDILKAFHALSP